MPNNKSAQRRMRSSARKQVHNRSVHTRLKSLEKQYLGLVSSGKKDEAATALKAVSSALDKAAKTKNVHKSTANRKKSRLAVRLVKLSKPAAAPAAAKA